MSTLHKGIALPWGITIPSVIEPKDDRDVIKSSVIWIVCTALGERVMRPDFGSLVPSLLFNPIDVPLLEEVKASVRDAIRKWDDRVRFVDFVAEKRAANTVRCTLTYEIILNPRAPQIQVAEWQISEGMLTTV